MKRYNCTIVRVDRHGHYKSVHRFLAEVTVIANNKKEAKEYALLSMLGKRSAEIGEIHSSWRNTPIGFPIDFEHAPEATKEEQYGGNVWSMTYEGTQAHKVNEYDIRMKEIMVKVEEIKDEV